jgi:hypothetical protein
VGACALMTRRRDSSRVAFSIAGDGIEAAADMACSEHSRAAGFDVTSSLR